MDAAVVVAAPLLPSAAGAFWTYIAGRATRRVYRPMLMGKENWPGLVALTSIFLVELPGIEPASLPGQMPSEMRFRYVSFQFVPGEYLQVSVRLLTPSRGITTFPAHQVHWASPRAAAAGALRERARFAAPSCS